MSISPELPFDALAQEALNHLKGKENPFESLVRPQKGDTRFRDLDVPGLLLDQRKLLLEIIDSYRVKEYTGGSDLRPTRVVIVRGDRGSGKTHLLRSLQFRPDGLSQILVKPSFCSSNLYFEEYLYSELVRVLLEEDEVYNGKPFEDIARAVTRRLLRQAVLGLGATDRIFACSQGRWARLRLLWGGGDRIAQPFDRLAHSLSDPASARELPARIKSEGLTAEQCLRLIEGHLSKHEKGTGQLVTLRRRLYSAMARQSLFGDSDAVARFLEGEYAQPDAEDNRRFEIVSWLLHAVIEVCALERFPIVFAFDNLERLLSPQSTLDGNLARGFTNSLAQAVDNTRGLLILLFAERGLFDRLMASHIDAFALDRLRQGVPLHGRGPVETVDLKSPNPEEITLLIKSRIKDQLLSDLFGSEQLPDLFPFSEKFIKDVTGAGTTNLRVAMQRLRDEYSRVVYQRQPAAEVSVGPEKPRIAQWDILLASIWKDKVGKAHAQLKDSPAAQASALHAGLGAMLPHAKPLTIGDWTLAEVQPGMAVGDHPSYGLVTLLDWRSEKNPAATNGADSTCRVGIGFLLAGGPGMAPDLQSKFDLFRSRSHGANRLIVLWPKAKEVDELAEALPTATKQVWTQSRYKSRTELKKPAWDDMCAMLAFPDWLAQVADASNGQAPAEAIQEFVRTRCQSIFPLIQPPQVIAERSVADEN